MYSALKEEKPQTFRDAGKSHMTLIRAIRTITLMHLPSFIVELILCQPLAHEVQQ